MTYALLTFQIILIILVWVSLRRAIRSPHLPPERPLSQKRVVTHPGGQFVVDDRKGRSVVINDDESLWREENNEG